MNLRDRNQCPVRARLRIGSNINAGINESERKMQLKVTVISDRHDEYVGKKGLVKNQVITCQDVDPSGYRLLMPFDYTGSVEQFMGDFSMILGALQHSD
jgi:hypothetical protein